jgi:DNA repair exonuclease SbcCD ATPase subunit
MLKMSRIFVLAVCFGMVCGVSLFAESTEKEELQKRIIELKAKQSEIAVQLNEITSKYIASSKKIQSLRKDLRFGKTINNNYDKTGVDEKTADLIDRYRAAEKKYAELKKELDEHFAKSDAGVARAKKFEQDLDNLKSEKESLHTVIQERAKILQEQKKVSDELKLAEAELKDSEK